MDSIALTKAELIKTYLYLKFEGNLGLGSSSNEQTEFIIQTTKDKFSDFKNVQAIIFDFTDLNYQFGNRLLRLFDPNVFKNNCTILISIIANEQSLYNWKSIIEYGRKDLDFYGTEKSIFQDSITKAIKSINKRFN